MGKSILLTITSCRFYVFSIFIVYIFPCSTGILLVQNGNHFALSQRDKIVGLAVKNDKASLEYQSDNKFSAVLFNFTGNVFISAIPQTLIGLAVLPPYLTVAYQGWVGGIVSVDGLHQSRFRNLKSTA